MLKVEITDEEIKKILPTQELMIEYLERLFRIKKIQMNSKCSKKVAIQTIIDTWDYDASKEVIRKMFFESLKYLNGQHCKERIEEAIGNWKEHNLGEFSWPFSAMNFDKRVVAINRMNLTEEEKDRLIASDVIKFRRIKDINTLRNDYIEHLIITNNNNIIPTLTHRSGVDFYINGEPYDQKVSKSVGKDFIELYGENYRQKAIEHPELVAKSLYEHQDSERFDDLPRLYIVYLDDNITNSRIEHLLSNINFQKPYLIEFDYSHANIKEHYRTHCFVVLLYN